jgi:hypothetical protein
MGMKHSVSHDLPFDLAKKAAGKALEEYRARFPDFDPQINWTGERTAEVTFKAMGSTLKGQFELLEKSIEMDMDVPLLMRPFKAKALEVIEEKIRDWINKAKAGALG